MEVKLVMWVVVLMVVGLEILGVAMVVLVIVGVWVGW